jgi:lysophospholipase L1-like esterase
VPIRTGRNSGSPKGRRNSCNGNRDDTSDGREGFPASGALTARTVPARSLKALVFIVLFPPAALAIALAVLRPMDVSWRLAGWVTGLWALAHFTAGQTGERGSRWVIALCACTLVLWPEMGLRATGFRFERAGAIVFGIDRPAGTIDAKRHPDLFWTLPPEAEGVNSEGFIGREFQIPKPEGVFRIAFFGDSCTQQGFPRMVERQLNAAGLKDTRFEAVNLGVAGYSSYQGREVARLWAEALEPNVGVVYFGWNDHWQAYAKTDVQRGSRLNRVLTRLLLASRTFQLLTWATGPKLPEPIGGQRVSLEEYRLNLGAIGETVGRSGGRVLLLTAPSAHRRRGVPNLLLSEGFAASKEDVVELHERYNDQVRQLAQQRDWPLLDLEREVQDLDRIEEIFMADGIHFTWSGLRWISSRITDELRVMSGGPNRQTRRSGEQFPERRRY